MEKIFELSVPFTIEDEAKDATKTANESLRISGYANTTTKDRQGDVIVSDAWVKGGLDNYRKNPIILAFHNHSKPIGRATELKVDSNGLKIAAEISSSAVEVYNLIKEGILKAFSVGFRVKDAEYDAATDIFVIKDVELYEVSVVSVPANQDSLFDVSKCFNNPADCAEFKKSFSKQQVTESTKEKFIMQIENLDQLTAQISEAAAKAAQAAVAQAEQEKQEKAAAEAAEAKKRAEMIQLGKEGAERLVEEVNKRVDDNVEDLRKQLADLTSALKEQSDKFVQAATRQSPIGLSDKGNVNDPSMMEKTTAVLVAKALGREIKDTKYGANLIEKSGPHVASAYWEDQVSLNMQDEIRKRLVVAPLFTTLQMPSNILRLPANPEAGYSTWVLATDYGTTSSSGAAGTHVLKEITLTAYKLATKEFLTYEEEDDSMIALMPIVRDAMIRRGAKAIDKALLRGAGSGSDPIKGISVWATAGDAVTITATTKVTVAQLQAVRRKMGDWGLDPTSMVYIVSSDAYYDLLDDTAFQTMDKVGPVATMLKGMIGSANGSPVIVSGEFATKASAAVGVVAVNAANFLFGQYKSLRMETAVDVEKQQKLLVATERLAFQQITTANGNGVAKYVYS